MGKQSVKKETVEYSEQLGFKIIRVTRLDAGAPFVCTPHWHDSLEINYIPSGHCRYLVDGELIDAPAGSLVLINPGHIHNVIVDDTAGDNEGAIVLLVNRSLLTEQLPDFNSRIFTNEDTTCPPELSAMITELSTLVPVTDPVDLIKAKSLLLNILYILCKSRCRTADKTNSKPSDNNDKHLKEIISYMDENYNKPIRQSEAAAQFYFTTQYFARYFKQKTGVTFTEYLTSVRLEKAVRRLNHSKESLSDIAEECGFSGERSFVDAFKKQYGITPTQYRKNKKIQ